MADIVAGGEGGDVTDQLIRLTHIAADETDERLIDRAARHQLHDRDIEAFLVDGIGVRPKAAPANVDDMRGAGEKPHQSPVMERGCADGDVVQMAGPLPRIIGDVDIALMDIVPADAADEMRHRVGHGVDVARRSGDGLCQHVAMFVVDASREIAGFAHAGRKGRAHQRLRLLLDDRDQPVPHHLIGDCREAHGFTLV